MSLARRTTNPRCLDRETAIEGPARRVHPGRPGTRPALYCQTRDNGRAPSGEGGRGDDAGIVPDLLEQCVARLMADELSSRRLSVALVYCWGWYGDEGRKRRVAEERNPGWYRRLCAMYQSSRSRPRRRQKPDTLIKRRHVLRALEEIEGGGSWYGIRPAGVRVCAAGSAKAAQAARD